MAAAWLLALVFAVPQLAVFGYRETDDSGYSDCWAVFEPAWALRVYITWTTLAIYVCPAVILAVSYTRICHAVIRSVRQRQSAAATSRCHGNHRLVMSSSQRCHGNVTSSSSSTSRWTGASSSTWSRGGGHVTQQVSPGGGAGRMMSNAKVRTIKLTVTVNVSYLVCWGPFFVSHVWAAYDSTAPFEGNIFSQQRNSHSCSKKSINQAIN